MLTVDHNLVLSLDEHIDPDQPQIVESNLLLRRETQRNRLDSNFVYDQAADTDHPESTIQLCPKIILQNYFAELRMDNSMLSTRLCYNSFLMKTPFHVYWLERKKLQLILGVILAPMSWNYPLAFGGIILLLVTCPFRRLRTFFIVESLYSISLFPMALSISVFILY
jgi:hypothetical protein